jgi:hypothetical protein
MVSLNASPAVSAAEFTCPIWLTHQAKHLFAIEVYSVDSTTNICVNIMCKRLYFGK